MRGVFVNLNGAALLEWAEYQREAERTGHAREFTNAYVKRIMESLDVRTACAQAMADVERERAVRS
jgi:hypothetical protein